ncbi:MAG: methylenetetrahydrofolate reductase [Acidimicrobiia bacterium]
MTTSLQELARLLAASKFEIIPLKNAASRARHLPHDSTVSVIASPAKDIDATLTMAEELQELGLKVIPHLAARMIQDQAQLQKLLARMGEAGMDQTLVIGGDATDPGDFKDAPQLLAAMADISHGVSQIGIAGYPEGHPLISDQSLQTAMAVKAPHASYITTQMCFDVSSIVTWIREIRAAGIELPVYVGIPGLVDPVRLASIGVRIGVGASVRYVLKNRSFLWKLLRPGPYEPSKLALGIAEACAAEDLGIRGFHIFTFNEIEPTVRWWRDELDRAGG